MIKTSHTGVRGGGVFLFKFRKMLPSIRDINLNTDPHSEGVLLQDIQVCAYGGHSVVERPRGGLRARGRGNHARAEAAAHAAPNGVQSSTINHVWRKNIISFLYFLSKKLAYHSVVK